jgi:hypothetical protein
MPGSVAFTPTAWAYLPYVAKQPTPTPTDPHNIKCGLFSRDNELYMFCAGVSEMYPKQYSDVGVKVIAAPLFVKQPVPDLDVLTVWIFKDRDVECRTNTGDTGLKGLCTVNIGNAEPGFRVNVETFVENGKAVTWFTPRE